MILIKNDQSISIDTDLLQKNAQIILEYLGYGDFDLGIALVANDKIQQYNKTYRAKDAPTDILSFPFYPELKPGQTITPGSEEEKNLGDLIIAPSYVQQDIKKLGVSFEHRMKRLLVHGICHLLGYDHLQDAEYAVMLAKEQELGKLIGIDIKE